MTDTCGHPTANDTPCEHPASEGDGRCWQHTDDDPEAGGRPSKLTKDRQERIATAIEEGVPLVAACRLNSITHQTHDNWMNRGEEQEEGIYAEYFGRLTRALGHDQSKKTQVLWETAKEMGDTKAMMTVLKNRYKETWADQDIGEAEGTQEFLFRREVVNEPDGN